MRKLLLLSNSFSWRILLTLCKVSFNCMWLYRDVRSSTAMVTQLIITDGCQRRLPNSRFNSWRKHCLWFRFSSVLTHLLYWFSLCPHINGFTFFFNDFWLLLFPSKVNLIFRQYFKINLTLWIVNSFFDLSLCTFFPFLNRIHLAFSFPFRCSLINYFLFFIFFLSLGLSFLLSSVT